jgi:hypothetical protein
MDRLCRLYGSGEIDSKVVVRHCLSHRASAGGWSVPDTQNSIDARSSGPGRIALPLPANSRLVIGYWPILYLVTLRPFRAVLWLTSPVDCSAAKRDSLR